MKKNISSSIKRSLSLLAKNANFAKLSETNKKKIIQAIKTGRAVLNTGTNKTVKTGGLHYTLTHTAKMLNLLSLSTSVRHNPLCEARRKDKKSICAKCFAYAQNKVYKNMEAVQKNNLDILKSRILAPQEIPVILSNSGFFRLEAFGDVCNLTQIINYLNIARYNPQLNCAVWTKNLSLYNAVFALGYTKPKNLNIVFSSPYINKVQPIPPKYNYFIDRVFTVYDNEGIKAQNIKINCGALSCATCGKCYRKTNKYFEISEKLK